MMPRVSDTMIFAPSLARRALLAAIVALSLPTALWGQTSGSLIFGPSADVAEPPQAAGSIAHASSASMQPPPVAVDDSQGLVPADPTQLPESAAPAQGGCGCASCRSGASHPLPPGVENNSWFFDDCPKAVISEGWCKRPFYFDGFVGAIYGDEFIDGQVNQQTSFMTGVRLGWDLDEAWGWEGRLAVADLDIANTVAPANKRQADLLMADVSLVHYFFTHLTTRPFISAGLGIVELEYVDPAGLEVGDQVFGVPIGIGIKHRYDDWLVFRFDLTDNIAFGGGTPIGTQHNFSATGSFELRFGGSRVSYWPWQPRRYYSW